MKVCPVCNGFETIRAVCPECRFRLQDGGKIYDYFDDYSPYMEIWQEKLEDGDPESSGQDNCVHLLYCPRCNQEERKTIFYVDI
ncbi:hypothetical protein [Heyndrickxia acidiproducens]|uniref:hypothetical protein n=1 Tax=Heyndrickxia acidiproducens TaxID=1121084 RepID=UPI00037EA043|nr:hypothetical protein [Heyndrickxia acidiproducens]